MGTGPGKKFVLVSVCSISICYRGADPLNQMSTSYETRHAKCRINFLPGAAVGSPAMAVYDTLPGSINPTEEIVVY